MVINNNILEDMVVIPNNRVGMEAEAMVDNRVDLEEDILPRSTTTTSRSRAVDWD